MRFLHALVLGLSLLSGCKHQIQPVKIDNSIQRRATHMVTYKDRDGEDVGVCTATAVGKHYILTAFHCDNGEHRTLTLDMSTREYHIVGYASDGRDHIIYRLDGPEFKDISRIQQREAILNERIYFYGNGGAHYPARRLDGNVVTYVDDPSEVDASAGMRYYSFRSIPGDSGSAVYGGDGAIIGLMTYRIGYDGRILSAGFELAFSKNVLAALQ